MLHLKSIDPRKKKVATLVVPVCENTAEYSPPVISELAREALKHVDFSGKPKEQLILYDLPMCKAACIIFQGLGPAEKVTAEILRQSAGAAVKTAAQKKRDAVLIATPDIKSPELDRERIITALLEGAGLANFQYNDYKSESDTTPLKKIELLTSAGEAKSNADLANRISRICMGTHLARGWVSMPPNDKRPEQFAHLLAERGRKAKLSVTVMTEKKLTEMKFGALLAVAAGSTNKPRLVIMDYNPKGAKQTIAFVGKGVTFDAGGINLKPSGSLEDMKMDMAGAAAVAGTLLTVAELKPDIRVIGAMPLVENMPSGDATRPGDIIRTYAGKTVEIGNTDAEGRLILIDTLAYIKKKYKPAMMIDLATLTGACIVALGEKIAGVFSPSRPLAKLISACGRTTHERCWQMPLPDDYKELLKSDFADLKNVSASRWGGAITAALFMSEFVGDTPWAHIDIAGPAYAKKANSYCGPGGTGFGVRLLCELLNKIETEGFTEGAH